MRLGCRVTLILAVTVLFGTPSLQKKFLKLAAAAVIFRGGPIIPVPIRYKVPQQTKVVHYPVHVPIHVPVHHHKERIKVVHVPVHHYSHNEKHHVHHPIVNYVEHKPHYEYRGEHDHYGGNDHYGIEHDQHSGTHHGGHHEDYAYPSSYEGGY